MTQTPRDTSTRRSSLGRQLLTPILVVGLISIAGTTWYSSQATEDQAVSTIRASARRLSNQIREMRGYYTANVVGPAKRTGMDIAFDHAGQDGAIPLPATFVHELIERINERYAEEGFQARLYSDYPFPFRTDGGARDDFEREALVQLRETPDQEYWVNTVYEGRPVVRFATADLMVNEGCVGCHNSHPESPKTDWAVGDVRGVLELVMPLEDGGITALRAGSRKTLFVFLLAFVLMGGVTFWMTRRAVARLDGLAGAAERLAVGDMEWAQEVDEGNDEIASVGASLHSIRDYLVDVADAADAVARGELDRVSIRPRSDADQLSERLLQMSDSLSQLTAELGGVVKAGQTGQLEERGDVGSFTGVYADLVQHSNEMMESVQEPLDEVRRVFRQLAARDLTARVEGSYAGAFHETQSSVNEAADKLQRTLAEVSSSAVEVGLAVREIDGNTQVFADGFSTQAQNAARVAASLTEMTAIARENDQRARTGLDITDETNRVGAEGTASMQRLSEAVSQIKTSSDDTARIVKTIDEIAFQTNLLALNAAVEAARAGDAGKGFAVVAEEVRGLALRAAEAARETTDLIDQSIASSEEGVRITEEAVGQLSEVNAGVSRIREVIVEISTAAGEHGKKIDEINQAVDAMNEVTQRAAAGAEERASTTQELRGQAEGLQGLVSQFSLGDEGSPRRKPGVNRIAATTGR